ncbi:MAG TPA: LCCL domain-containing protein, partial [Tepidisphaeraceae bacterium]|nr:LCCL domain-containing protein [Tepidisphaeraceae bacterium]
MILRDRVPLRLPRTGLMMIGLLMLAVLPMWSQNSGAQPLGPESAGSEAVARLPNPQGGTASQLPPDAQDAIQKFEQQQMEARRELERRLAEQRDVLVRQLKELQDRYTRAGQLDEAVAVRDRVRQLQGESAYGAGEPIPDPGNAIQFRGREHQSIRIMVTGATDGWIWGANPYTDDSSIATAAVQAGILRPGERGVVRIRMLPGRDHYEAATFNGVTSQAYGPWPGSYLIEPERIARPAKLHSYGPPPSALPDPGTLTEYRGHIGENFVFTVVGSTAATIWGTGTYTDDSPLSVVAVHAGLVSPGESKVVRVIILPGQDHYQGSTQNGVTSQDWGNFGGSYQVSALDAPTNGPRTSFGRPGDRIWQDAVPLPSGPRGDGTPSAAGPLNLMSLRDTAAALKEGRHLTLHCQIRGSNVGTVWGTGTYTDDSSIAAAAVHEGVLTDG